MSWRPIWLPTVRARLLEEIPEDRWRRGEVKVRYADCFNPPVDLGMGAAGLRLVQAS